MESVKPMIIAHRGAKGLVQYENTIEAFQKAIEVKADCIEIDIRKTKDNQIIVYHDPDIDGVLIKDLNYDELLARSLYKIPTLVETLEFIKGKILIDIEFKESGYVEEALEIIQNYLNNDEFYIRSFNDDVIVDVKAYDKTIKSSLLLGRKYKFHQLYKRFNELFPVRRIKKSGCDYVSPHYRLLKFGFMWRMKRLKKKISVWTVNDEKVMKKMLLKKKVHGIVTDYPDKAREILLLIKTDVDFSQKIL